MIEVIGFALAIFYLVTLVFVIFGFCVIAYDSLSPQLLYKVRVFIDKLRGRK